MITVAADVAAKGKARLPFLFLDHFWQNRAGVGEQHKMHAEKEKQPDASLLSLSIRA